MKLNVSIIIPTVNRRPQTLLRTIYSVMHQKKGNIINQTEILISNNSSRALEGEEVVELQQQGLLQVIDSSAVRGRSFANNQGVAVAKYDIISFLDDDDWWCETFLLELGQALVEKNVDLVCCGYWSHTELGKSPGFQPSNSVTEENLFLNHPLACGCNLVMRKNVFTKLGGFDEKYFTTQDKEFFVRFVKGNYRFYAFQSRLLNVDRTSGWRNTLPTRNKVISQKYFYKEYASEMSPETRRSYLAKIEFNEALINASFLGHIKLFFVCTDKQKNIIIKLLKVQIPDRWPRLYKVGMWGIGLAKVTGLWKFVRFTWRWILAVSRRF